MKNDGGPAFPGDGKEFSKVPGTAGGTVDYVKYSGMSLRDYFAAAALQGMCAHGYTFSDTTSRAAYLLADAMLAERDK